MRLHTMLLTAGALFCTVLLFASARAEQQYGDNGSSVVWGGRGILMRTTSQGATIQFECAQGTMQQPIQSSAGGDFSVPGTYTPERGGPVQKDNPPSDLPATYQGTITGDTMHLEIILSDKSLQPQPFTLTKGKIAKVVRCR